MVKVAFVSQLLSIAVLVAIAALSPTNVDIKVSARVRFLKAFIRGFATVTILWDS